MKNIVLTVTPVGRPALVVPALAQNQPKTTSDQPQDQTQAQPTQTADQSTATGKEALKYERHEGFWGHLNPLPARAM